jgi:hypothetical protein
VGNEAELTLVMKAKNLASREVDKLHGSLSKVKGGAGRAAAGLKTLAKGAAILAGGGLLLLIGGLGMATKAAAEEQKGIARLDAALRANDKSFRGNTDAIEKVIAKREGLAFADDQLRDSLTILVGKYKDTDKALALQTTAMDLARLKGISLTDATAMLSKGLDGSTKILKTLGITLPATATEQERLTAIQKVAAGQAEAYGKTAAGAQEAFQIAIGNVVEDLGSALLPVMATVFTWLREKAIPAVKGVIATVQKWMRENRPLIDQVKAFAAGVLRTMVTAIGNVVSWIGKLITKITSNKDAMNFLKTVVGLIATAFDVATTAIGFVIGKVAGFVDKLTKNKTVIAAFKTAINGAASAFKAVRTAIGFVIDRISALIRWVREAITWLGKLNIVTGSRAGGGPNAPYHPQYNPSGYRAAGGPVMPHRSYIVGEQGPELLQMGAQAGTIVPNHRLPTAGGGGGASGSPVVIALMLDGREVGRVVDERLYYAVQRAAPTLGRA